MLINSLSKVCHEAKRYLIEKLEGWQNDPYFPNPFRYGENAIIPRTVEINCRLINSEGGGTASWTATLHRSGGWGITGESAHRRAVND